MERKDMIASLTKREIDIMTILWNSPKAMIASEIASAEPTLTVNTVQAVLRKLLKNKLITVDSIVYNNTVLCRSYKPLLSEQDFALCKLSSEYQKIGASISKASLVSALLDANSSKEQTKKDLIQLRQMLDEYTRKAEPHTEVSKEEK